MPLRRVLRLTPTTYLLGAWHLS